MLFDGVCILCSGTVAFILRHETAPVIEFVAIQSIKGRQLAKAYGIDPDVPDSFLFLSKGDALTKSTGVIALAQHLKRPWRWVRVFTFIPRSMRDKIYDIVAKNRYQVFGKSDTCIVPHPQERHRFSI